MFLHSSAMEGEEWRACCFGLGGRETPTVSERGRQKRAGEKVQVEQDYFRKYREQRTPGRKHLKRV